MEKKYLPLIALAAGFISAFLTAGVHSMFFVLLPLLAFVFGYFSSWRSGLLCGFLLFLGYTFATALMWWGISPNLLYPLQYFYAFIFGGFSILLIGALAPVVRRGIRKIGSVAVLFILAFFMVWCGSLAWTDYSYYHQVIIHSSEDLGGLELYLPAGTVSGVIYEELYNNPLRVPGRLTEEYTLEFVDTEYGRMLKVTITEFMSEGPPGYPYTGNIIFKQENPPRRLIHLMPRYDVVPLNEVSWGESIGLLKVKEDRVIEEFKVPIKIKSSTDAEIELRLENRTGRGESINFAYSKSNTYTELITYEGKTGDDWVLVPVQATSLLRIREMGD